MDFELKCFQKKAETANEIVKYLNLELENYKDTYQIFGANMANENGTPNKTKGIEQSPKK